MKGHAPGWSVRCTKCGTVREASEVGIIRIRATSPKYTLGWCKDCGWFRFIAIEKKPVDAP
jgi:RNase P subunit RPR2